jgi:hypothetical protein
VTINGRETRFVLTDDDGAFAVEGLGSQVVIVCSARRPGFYETSAKPVSPKDAENVLLKLAPAAVIVGRVVGADEEPVEHALVQLYSQVNEEGKKKWRGAAGTQTDEDGRFRLPNLRSGSYLISVSPSQNPRLTGEPSYASVYFPNAPDRRSASPVRVSAGQQFEANFNLVTAQLFDLTGKVVGPLVDGVALSITEPSGMPLNIPAATNPRTGMFQIRGVPRGTYVIRANGFHRGGSPLAQLRGHLTLTVTSDRNDLILSLQPPISIPIVIRRDTVQGNTPSQEVGPGVSVRAIALDNEEQQAYSNYQGPPEQGHLVLEGLDPGRYRVAISSYGEFYVASASFAGTNLLSEPLAVTTSSPDTPIEIVLRNDVAKIRATVRGDVPQAMLVVLPDRGENPQPVVGICQPQSGCFVSQQLRPGNYTIYAFDRVENVEYADRKALEAYSSKAVHVTLSPDQTTDVTVDVIQTEP